MMACPYCGLNYMPAEHECRARPRTVLEGVDFDDLWNDRERLKADKAALEAEVRALREALQQCHDVLTHIPCPTGGGGIWVQMCNTIVAARRLLDAARR